MEEPKIALSAYEQLSPKRRAFVDAYVALKFNGVKAAIEAGYSKKTAKEQAASLLTILNVKEAIKEKTAAAAERNRLKTDDVLKELMSIGFSNVRQICRWSGNTMIVRDSRNLPPEVTAAIAEISPINLKDGTPALKIKLHSKTAALEMLGRYLSMFPNKMQVEGPDGKDLFPAYDYSKLTAEELRRLLALAEKATVQPAASKESDSK